MNRKVFLLAQTPQSSSEVLSTRTLVPIAHTRRADSTQLVELLRPKGLEPSQSFRQRRVVFDRQLSCDALAGIKADVGP